MKINYLSKFRSRIFLKSNFPQKGRDRVVGVRELGPGASLRRLDSFLVGLGGGRRATAQCRPAEPARPAACSSSRAESPVGRPDGGLHALLL